MNEQLQTLIDARDEAMVAYSLTDSIADKAFYNRSVKALREYINQNSIDMNESEIDILTAESAGVGRIHEEFKFVDSDYDQNEDEEY